MAVLRAEHKRHNQVRQLAEKLVAAHEATVEWLTVSSPRRPSVAPRALVATPVQKVPGGVARVANAPVRLWANTGNSAVDTVKHAVSGPPTGSPPSPTARRSRPTPSRRA